MDNKTARQDLETVLRVEDLALGSMRKLRAIQDWLRAEAAQPPAIGEVCRCIGPGNGCDCERCDDTHPPAKVPAMKLAADADDPSEQAYRMGWNDCRAEILTTPTPKADKEYDPADDPLFQGPDVTVEQALDAMEEERQLDEKHSHTTPQAGDGWKEFPEECEHENTYRTGLGYIVCYQCQKTWHPDDDLPDHLKQMKKRGAGL